MTASVGVVTTVGCPYCKKAKAALRDKGVEYAEADLGSARDVLAKVKETTGQGTVPQVRHRPPLLATLCTRPQASRELTAT